METAKQTEQPMFSIIVPVYNTETYLPKCLDSIVNQTYRNFELILVNDGSEDASLQICRKYERENSNIVVVDKKNGGLVSAREAGLKAACGVYVGFVDSDDWIDENLLLDAEGVIQQYAPDIISYNVLLEFSDKQIKQELTVKTGFYDKKKMEKDIYPIMLYNKNANFYNFGIYPSLSNKFFKRELAFENKCTDYRITMGEDAACTYVSFLKANSSFIMKGYYYHYRQNPFSMTNAYDSNRFQKYSYLINYMKKVLNIKDYDLDGQLKAHKAFCVKHAILNESRAPFSFHKKRINLKMKMKQYQFEDAFDDLGFVKAGIASKIFIFLVKRRWYGCLIIMCEIFKILHRF